MEMTKDVFDEYGNYKFPDYLNSQYTNNVSATGGAIMGMTIDEADTILSCERLDSSMGCGASDEDIDNALGVAIDTMRKYQKIEGIIKVHDAVMMPEDRLYIDRIRKVLEDGKDN